MKKVYRINSVYHMLFVLCLINRHEENHLILGHKSLFGLYDKLFNTGIFTTITKIEYPKSYLGKGMRLFLPGLIKILRLFVKKDTHIFTCPNDVEYKSLMPFAKASKISLIEDGVACYSTFDGNNPLYMRRPLQAIDEIKRYFGLPYINIYRLKIHKFYLTNPSLLKQNLPDIYSYLNDSIVVFDINKEILRDVNKKLILDIFGMESYVNKGKKMAILLTQPLVEDNKIDLSTLLKKYLAILEPLVDRGYSIYLKQHPREVGNKYIVIGIDLIEIPKLIPFEVLALSGITFDVGITYKSTAMSVDFIKEKIFIEIK
ncbi:glycosyltransferase family 52 [Candidatus Contubernalis alkaliaceticus]|uniref:glycosyltransferase family 52 n=1 Tax=Candidatus Contubernalis alkaliaceticus TaxID=338645 RepID=UPI001F4C1354|nr:glycosyltransferase family 52 [Candidatus Contubernalis alkalaceticus]UNC93562.1 hypothetical protein HUE98_16655 [Candidatus Contubernalis alkalaceticus]